MSLSLLDSKCNIYVDKIARVGVLLNHLSDMISFHFPFSSFPRIPWLIRMNGFVNLKLQAMFIVKNSHKNLPRASPITIYTSPDVNRIKRVTGYLSVAE